MTFLLYAESNLALSEVMYIKMKCGEDYTDMTPDTAGEILEEAGELCGANEDTLGALASVIRFAYEHDDIGTTIQAAIDLYQLTGDEKIGDLARNLIKAVDEANVE